VTPGQHGPAAPPVGSPVGPPVGPLAGPPAGPPIAVPPGFVLVRLPDGRPALMRVAPPPRPPAPQARGWRADTDSLLWAVFCGFAAFALLYGVRAPVGRSIAFGVAIALVFGACYAVAKRVGPRTTLPAPAAPRRRSAQRWQVPGLEALAHQEFSIDQEAARLRIREAVAVSLAQRGLTLDSPGAERELGADVLRLLRPDTADLPDRDRPERWSRADRRAVIETAIRLVPGWTAAAERNGAGTPAGKDTHR
jgi:hypothetical protein